MNCQFIFAQLSTGILPLAGMDLQVHFGDGKLLPVIYVANVLSCSAFLFLPLHMVFVKGVLSIYVVKSILIILIIYPTCKLVH